MGDLNFLEECIIFGFHLRGEIFEVLTFCILIAKYYIYNKRLLDDNNIEFLHFLYVLKFKLVLWYYIDSDYDTRWHSCMPNRHWACPYLQLYS